MSEVTQRMMDTLCYKSYVSRKEEGRHATQEFRKGARICMERARLMTESYRETEGQPDVIRRAKALDKILNNMTIYIRGEERIVGNFASDPYSFNTFPELATDWLNKSINDGYSHMVDAEAKRDWQDTVEYWKGKSIDDRTMAALPDSVMTHVDFNTVAYCNHFRDSVTGAEPNYERLLKTGLKGVIEKAEKRLADLKSDPGTDAADYVEQRDFLEAAIISCRAVVNFAHRYSQKAREMAESEPDGKRRAELNEIAQICDWVPENPARTLREAMQSYWLVYMITRIIETHGQGAGNRLDQLMYPYYTADAKAGRITRQEAQELVEFFLVKVEETGHLCVPEMHTGGAGVSMYQSYTMGGQTTDGRDATNEFSFIMIDAAIAMKTHHTNYILRYHPNINEDFVLRAIDLIRTGVGFPAVFNDSCIIPYLVKRGVPLEDARNYVIRGCVGWLIPGKANHVGRVNAGSMSLGKCLELALNQGKCQLTGRQLGCATPDPTTFSSIEDIMQAYLAQVRFAFDKLVKIDNIAQHFYVKHMQRPFASALIDDCIEKGRDCSAIPYHLLPSIMPTGTTNVADSLAAIKKFVFDEKRLTMRELLDVLRSNWQGKEDLRQRFINEAPKFGNDDDYADLIAREVHHRSQKVAEEFKDYYGFPWSLNGSIAGGYYPWGRRAGASADGRKDKDTFSDAVMSPSAGMDRRGPTAVIKSVSKVPATWPELCNQKFMPQFLEGDNKKIFAAYLKTWADMGNYHIQFNVVDKETLLDAQSHPEKYSNLVVRVAGYSAFFVDLTRGLQDDIIRRTAQRF